jgi:hypothetical protein
LTSSRLAAGVSERVRSAAGCGASSRKKMKKASRGQPAATIAPTPRRILRFRDAGPQILPYFDL